MASYVESVLAPGERIVHRAALSHWKYGGWYAVALCLVLGGLAIYAGGRQDRDALLLASVPVVAGLLLFIAAIVRRKTTELVLTDRRIITKRGLIARDTVEMNLGKVESLHVSQGLLGRLLGFGDITVVGTGSSLEPLRGISQPLELRRKLGEVAGADSARIQA